MRVIICGCRSLKDPLVIERAVAACPFGHEISVVLSGGQATYDRLTARPIGGADWLAEQWAAAHGLKVEQFLARWDDVTTPGAVVKIGYGGRPYNARAGPDRNARMLDAGAEGLLAIWDGKSTGTGDMIRQAMARKRRGQRLLVHVHQWNP